jgi:exodeoxyribonuclease-3
VDGAVSFSAMTWNVLFGGEDRFDRILALLARERPDVTVLQECLGWDAGDRLARASEAAGAAHSFLGLARPRGSGRRFHVALLSRFPILSSTTLADPARVGHVIVDATVDAPGGSVSILGTHFDSQGEDERLRDAAALASLVPRERFERERLLVAGDLNALSRLDPYPADLAARLAASGVDKYGHPPRFDTMERLASGGWIDLRPDPWVTARRDRGGVHIEYRTDYLLASPALARDHAETRVLDCKGASDHEPVLARFRV